jgi:hypothetical protein
MFSLVSNTGKIKGRMTASVASYKSQVMSQFDNLCSNLSTWAEEEIPSYRFVIDNAENHRRLTHPMRPISQVTEKQ